MAIRKKDGNLYILEGPNPLVATQVAWDPSTLVFHNFLWDEITFSKSSTQGKYAPREETIRHEAPKQDDNLPTPETFRHETPASKNTPTPLPETTKVPEPTQSPVNEEPREFDLPYIKYKVLCHCLPAKVKKHTDRLYGESWQKITYGNKFIFPCVMIESGDTEISFWTSDPRGQVAEKSIVYPFAYEVHNTATDSYDRVPYDEYRWWKVSNRESREGGWLFTCAPSEIQPDFSD